jgi:hypothetical protein
MFNLDLGSSGGSGPFLAWSAIGTRDGSVPARSFYVRDGGNKTPYDASKGFVLDIDALKTGWQHSEGAVGVAPSWKWNESVSQMMAKPGDDWKKGFSVPCATGGGAVATWEQAGASAWQALEALAPLLSQRPDAKSLPVVRLAEAKFVQFTKGSTVVPILEIVKWTERPDALKDGVAAGIALEPAAPAPAAAAPAPMPAADIDDAEF